MRKRYMLLTMLFFFLFAVTACNNNDSITKNKNEYRLKGPNFDKSEPHTHLFIYLFVSKALFRIVRIGQHICWSFLLLKRMIK